MRNHEYFETLCTLAMTGQLSAGELQEFTEHWANCPTCRTLAVQIAEVSSALLGLDSGIAPSKVPSGMLDRFREQAHREGILLDCSATSLPYSKAMRVGLALYVLGLALLLPSMRHRGTRPMHQPLSDSASAAPPASGTSTVAQTSRDVVSARPDRTSRRASFHQASSHMQRFRGLSSSDSTLYVPASPKLEFPRSVTTLQFYTSVPQKPTLHALRDYVWRSSTTEPTATLSQVARVSPFDQAGPASPFTGEPVRLCSFSRSDHLWITPQLFRFQIPSQ